MNLYPRNTARHSSWEMLSGLGAQVEEMDIGGEAGLGVSWVDFAVYAHTLNPKLMSSASCICFSS